MRFAAYGMCGDVTATTVPADLALIRTWLVTFIGGLAEPADRHPRDHHPGARVAARRRKRDGYEFPHSSPEPAKAQVPQEPEATVRALPGAVAADGQAGPSDSSPPGRGNTEAGFLSGMGNAVYRHVAELLSRVKRAFSREASMRNAADRTARRPTSASMITQGGDRSWLLRLLIPVGDGRPRP